MDFRKEQRVQKRWTMVLLLLCRHHTHKRRKIWCCTLTMVEPVSCGPRKTTDGGCEARGRRRSLLIKLSSWAP